MTQREKMGSLLVKKDTVGRSFLGDAETKDG